MHAPTYTYEPDVIANAVIYLARQTGVPAPRSLTHMKLQKLVFFVHAWGLALHDQSPLSERPQAWEYGPVFDSLYHVLKSYGSRPVDEYLTKMNPATGQRQAMIPTRNDRTFWNLLEQVCTQYGNLSALQLSDLSHEPDGPWEKARAMHNGWLDDAEVAAFYREKLVSHASG